MDTGATDAAPEIASRLANVGKDIDCVLSQQMTALSLQERLSMQEEAHGVSSLAVEETPELIQSSLEQLEIEISKLPNESAYAKAIKMDGGQYVRSQAFQLKFLRADLFDACKAAKRMSKCCRLHDKYFGEIALQRPLRFEDLSKKEQLIYKAGGLQVLPERDRSGRLVEFHFKAMNGGGISVENRVRVYLYHHELLSDDIESQKKGVVKVAQLDKDVLNDYFQATPEEREDLKDCAVYIPFRYSAQHFCMPENKSSITEQMLKGLWWAINRSKADRFHLQLYSSLDTEVIYKLMTFGIPSDLPITSSGNLKNKNHLKWIKMRKAMDEELSKDPTGAAVGIACPAAADVLFESGGGKSRHCGNLEFAAFMEQKIGECGVDAKYGDEYYEEVIAIVKQRNGRFLERDPEGRGWWVEVNDMSNLHTKLYSALYDQKKRMKVRQSSQQLNLSESDSLSAVHPDKKRQRLCQGL